MMIIFEYDTARTYFDTMYKFVNAPIIYEQVIVNPYVRQSSYQVIIRDFEQISNILIYTIQIIFDLKKIIQNRYDNMILQCNKNGYSDIGYLFASSLIDMTPGYNITTAFT